MLRLLVLAVFFATAPAASAWMKYEKSVDGDEFYLDVDTIKVNGNLRKVWQVQNYKEPNKEGVKSYRILTEIDCKEERYRILQFSSHTGPMVSGETLSSHNSANDWSYIPPDSIFLAGFKIVCAATR